MPKEKLLEELYLMLISGGPGFRSSIEFWDPTLEAIELLEDILCAKNNDEETK